MLKGFSKNIEVVANLGIILVACLLATVLLKNYLFKNQDRQASQQPLLQSQLKLPGADLSSLDVDWKQSKQTLVMAISNTCHFCTESAPFYKRLVENKHGARLIAVLPQSVEEGTHYLGNLGVAVDEIKQVSLSTIDVRGTPTLILVNSDGVVVNSWVGKLAPQDESLVLASLGKEE